MRAQLCILFALLSLVLADDVVLRPTNASLAAFPVGLVLIQGAQVTAAQYIPLATAIQRASAKAVWVGIPELFLDAATPLNLQGGIQKIVQSMVQAGMPKTATMFYAGHSQGGAMLQDFVNTSHVQINATGQILLGSYILRKYNNQTFPVPTLTVGGELDGLSRVTRLMEAFHRQILQAEDTSAAISTFPVVVISGMNHFDSASGQPPILVRIRDLKSEISADEAHATIAALVSTFLEVRLKNTTGLPLLAAAVKNTNATVQPLIKAYQMEGFYHFKPPCYDEKPGPACQTGCPWTEIGQEIMGGIEEGRLKDVDTFHPVSQINPIHLPHIFNNCTAKETDCVLNTTTVSQCVYEDLDSLDTAFFPTSANEIRAKLKSRQATMNAAGLGPTDFNKTDGGSLCQSINQAAFDWAVNTTAPKTMARYKAHGEAMMMGEDKGPYNVGPLWIYSSLEFNKKTDAKGNGFVEVQSPMLRTPIDFVIQLSAGFHYCKLLSPARAMEWIYVDGLRANYGI